MMKKMFFQQRIVSFLLFLIVFGKIASSNDFNKYYFTMYPSQNSQTPYILNAYTPLSEHLKIDFSQNSDENMIKREKTKDYVNANFTSVSFYENEYMIKTCFGANKIVEIIPIEKNDTTSQTSNYIFSSGNKNISNYFVFCYSTLIQNPDSSIKDTKVIITYWVEITSKKDYSHKCVLFYPNSKIFSDTYTLSSPSTFQISTKYPLYCTTFREKDIFCSYYDSNLNNQFVIETNKIKKQPCIYFILSDFGQINGNNMKPFALNKKVKSIFGGFYDVFLAEFHNNIIGDKNSTVLLYSLYRKSLHISIVPMFANLELFFGTNIRDAYIGINLFNFILESNEIILFFIHNNYLKVVRVDYSVQNNLFKSFKEIQNLGYFSEKLENCKIPKYMQSTYFTNKIKYNSNESSIVNQNIKKHYIYKQDIAVLLTCSNTDSNSKEDISYYPKTIELPQCLNYLDLINGNNIHKINFYLSISTIIYDIYDDPRLQSFREVGLVFYPYEKHYMNLILVQIKLKSQNNYIIAKNNYLYKDITHIRFQRIRPKYIPYFTKPFQLKYRLYYLEDSNSDNVNRMTSNVCFFQIKFFPYESKTDSSSSVEEHSDINNNTTINIEDTNIIEPEKEDNDLCSISYCAICSKEESTNKFICESCDSSELAVIVKDTNKNSDTFGKCVCDTSLGFYKDPIENTCRCQEDYSYYKSTNLCWPEKKLKDGPYYIEAIDDITEIPIYNDCYTSCKKCSKGGDEKNHKCEECKEGFAYIDEDKTNCYDKNELKQGYHEIEPDHYIKCHENCISCIDKPFIDEEKNIKRQFCTECKNNVPFFIRENKDDEYFNCFETKCDENKPTLMFLYSEKSNECIKECNNGVLPYNNSKICLEECNNDFPFLDISTKKCYSSCEYNKNENKISNVDEGICTNKCEDQNLDGKCFSCEKNMYKNKEGFCVEIPKQCFVVDNNSGLCKLCNEGYYPLKHDLKKEYFNCYKTLEEIRKDLNRIDFYLNKTEKYWDECYGACETCYSYGSENRQKCLNCKYGYHFEYYFENIYNNCRLNLTANKNCTSSQADIYKYKDYCHLCKENYSFVYGTDQCMKTEELENGPFYRNKIIIKIGDYRTEEKEVDLYNPCYKYCKTCNEKGDYYEHKCTSCYDGYKYEEKTKKCLIDSSNTYIVDNSDQQIIPDLNKETHIEEADKEKSYKEEADKEKNDKEETDKEKYDKEETDKEKNDKEETDKKLSDKDETDKEKNDKDRTEIFDVNEQIDDRDENIWFKLGEDSFYFYKQNNCIIIFYDSKIFLISNKKECTNICYKWDKYNCQLKNYTRFENITREDYDNLINESHEYDNIKNNVNIIVNIPEKKLSFHLTNYASETPKNLSYIDISEYQNTLRQYFGSNILLMKVDIKRSDTRSTQVEYQFYNPNDITEKVNLEEILSQRRLDKEETTSNNWESKQKNKFQIKIDLPIDWTEEQIEKINYLRSQNIDAFNTSSEFYLDNCNQFTSAKGNDVFLKERKKIYYPDIPFCENNCTFIKYVNETQKVTCKCNYKTNSNNYKDVRFEKNPVDEKFVKNIFLENFQSMKCLKEIFKWENLKSNAGFIITMVFIIIYIISIFLYYISSGFVKIQNIVKLIAKKDIIKGIIQKSVKKKEILIDNRGNNSNNSGGNIKNSNNSKGPHKLNYSLDSVKSHYKNKGKKQKKTEEINIKDKENIKKQKNIIISEGPQKLNYSIDSRVSHYRNRKNESKNSKHNTNKNKEIKDNNGENINNESDFNENEVNNHINKNNENNSINNKSEINNNSNQIINNDNKKGDNNKLINNDYINKSISNNKKEIINNNLVDDNVNTEINEKGEKDKPEKIPEEEVKVDDNNNQNTKSIKSFEFELNNNIILNSMIKNSEVKNDNDQKNNENNEENVDNISTLKIDDINNVTFQTIKQSQNAEEENGSSNNSYLISENSVVDPKEFINKEKNNTQNLKEKNLGKSDISENIHKKNNYDTDPDINSQIGKSIQFLEFTKKKKEYNKDSDIYSVNSDLISNFSDVKIDKSNRVPPNPPGKPTLIGGNEPNTTERLKDNENINFDNKELNRNKFGKIGKFLQTKFGNNSTIDDEFIKKKLKLLTLEDFINEYKSFPLIYLDDLKKHHLLYFVFCACQDNNNFFLKLSFFSLTFNLYFALNTMLIFDSNMSDAYYDKEKSKPAYIALNLLLPFIICGLVAFIAKIFVMPSYTIDKMVRIIQSNGETKIKKHNIKNKKQIVVERELPLIYSFYKKKVIIYFIVGFIVLCLNWYMMTSFCAIFRNSGFKLIINSMISILASFVHPFILGLIPSGIGYLSIKTKNESIYQVYKNINYII